jgi:hypothetical protein
VWVKNSSFWASCGSLTSRDKTTTYGAPFGFWFIKRRGLDFPNIPLYPRQLQQTKVFPNAILNLPREFARLFRGEEFFAARRAPIHLCTLDYRRDLLVARRKLLSNSLHAVRTTNCAGSFHIGYAFAL